VLFVMLALSAVAQGLIGDLFQTGPTLGESGGGLDMPEALAGLYPIQLVTGGIGAFLGLVMVLPVLIGRIGSGWTNDKLLLRIVRWLVVLALPVLIGLFGVMVPALLLMFVTFIVVGILYLVLIFLIWLVGRFFPTWRFVDLKLALRSMLVGKGRAASTLLALVVGVFTLSLMTMMAESITNLFEQVLINEAGGNVLVMSAGRRGGLDRVSERLDEIEGVNSYAAVATYDAELVSLTDVSEGRELSRRALEERARSGEGDTWGIFMLEQIDGRALQSNLPDVEFYAGRQLDPADVGPWDPEQGEYPPIVLSMWEATRGLGIEVGDLITYEVHEGGSPLG